MCIHLHENDFRKTGRIPGLTYVMPRAVWFYLVAYGCQCKFLQGCREVLKSRITLSRIIITVQCIRPLKSMYVL